MIVKGVEEKIEEIEMIAEEDTRVSIRDKIMIITMNIVAKVDKIDMMMVKRINVRPNLIEGNNQTLINNHKNIVLLNLERDKQ